MRAILWLQFVKFKRNFGLFAFMLFLTFIFSFAAGSGSNEIEIKIPVYGEKTVQTENWVEKLNADEQYFFFWEEKAVVTENILKGRVAFGLELTESDFALIIMNESPTTLAINAYIQTILRQEKQKETMLDQLIMDNPDLSKDTLRMQLEENLEVSIVETKSQTIHNENDFIYNSQLQAIFGFTLFFVIYTIADSVADILRTRQNGVWSRLILSKMSKASLYAGHLIYSFLIGYIQIMLIFILYKFWLGVDFQGAFIQSLVFVVPYIISIVAISIIVVSFVKTLPQFNAIIPLLSVSIAMLGGAYWPIEIVKSEILLLLSKFSPITYGMEGLKGLTVYGLTFSQVLYPFILLILISIVLVGIGINVIERRG